jgi:hypothetical protein
MDCKTTCLSSNPRAGLTLVELMVAMGLASLVFLALGSLSIYSATSLRSMVDYSELNSSSRMALDQISREIRRSRGVSSAPSNSTSMTLNLLMDADTTASVSYDKLAKKVTFTRTGEKDLVLSNCAYFNWKFYTHATLSGNFEPVETTTASECKVIELQWLCSRDNWRKATNSESIQSMKVVIRKKPD